MNAHVSHIRLRLTVENTFQEFTDVHGCVEKIDGTFLGIDHIYDIAEVNVVT